MKWAILIPQYVPETIGGNTVYVREFSRHLVKSGHEVHVFASTLRADLPSTETVDGVTVHRIRVKSGSAGPLRFSTTASITRRFVQVDREARFDVLNPNAAFQVDYSRVRKGLAIIHTAHAVATYEYLYLLKKIIGTLDLSAANVRELAACVVKVPISYVRERRALRRADKIVVMSRYVQERVSRFVPNLPDSRIVLSRIGVDPIRFHPTLNRVALRQRMGIPSDCILFFTARRLAHRMGLENLVDAFSICVKRYQKRSLHLFIAGGGALRRRLESRVDRLEIGHRVRLLGFVTDQDLLGYYQCADAFVLPSEDLEGFGIVSIEAMACNLPVIATPVGANREVVGDFFEDLVAASTSAVSIAATMDRFVEDIDRYKLRGAADKVRKRYAWDDILRELMRDVVDVTP